MNPIALPALPARRRRRERWIEWPMLLATVGLMGLGALFVASATLGGDGAAATPWLRRGYVRQMIWYVLGAGGLRGLSSFVPLVVRWAMVACWLAIALLMRSGARHRQPRVVPGAGFCRPFQFQPSGSRNRLSSLWQLPGPASRRSDAPGVPPLACLCRSSGLKNRTSVRRCVHAGRGGDDVRSQVPSRYLVRVIGAARSLSCW
jgi:hypothetical protein